MHVHRRVTTVLARVSQATQGIYFCPTRMDGLLDWWTRPSYD